MSHSHAPLCQSWLAHRADTATPISTKCQHDILEESGAMAQHSMSLQQRNACAGADGQSLRPGDVPRKVVSGKHFSWCLHYHGPGYQVVSKTTLTSFYQGQQSQKGSKNSIQPTKGRNHLFFFFISISTVKDVP